MVLPWKKRRFWRNAAAALAFGIYLPAVPAFAAEDEMVDAETNEFTASYLELVDSFVTSERIPSARLETPANVYVITAAEIEANHYQDVGEALRDYILNGRPASEANQIFLRAKAPYTPLASAVTLGEVYERCCVAAGLPASKKFHNLRRALGTSMISNGVSVYDVAQVFGDKNVESVKPYLAADEKHLKMCSLSFDGIAPLGGDA